MLRVFLHLALFCNLSLGLLGGPQSRAEADLKVTLLGTASPAPRVDRFGPSTLVEAGDQKLLFDAGRGVPIRMRQLKIPLGDIDILFITHYHSDHTSGIPDLWLTGSLRSPYGRRARPFRVIGPAGAKALMSNLEEAYALDIKIRQEEEKSPIEGFTIVVEEIEDAGVVYEHSGVRVIAFQVEHGPVIKPAVGYRIEYKGRSVVLSGDTRYDENVIQYGAGADLLIHEVASARPALLAENNHAQLVLAHHTSPRDAGRVFSQTKPKLAVYTHLVLLSDENISEPTPDEIIAETRQTYGGPLVVGEDLMSFEIGDSVTVLPYKP